MVKIDGRVDVMSFPYRLKKDTQGNIFARLPKEVSDGLEVDYLDLVEIKVRVIKRQEHVPKKVEAAIRVAPRVSAVR